MNIDAIFGDFMKQICVLEIFCVNIYISSIQISDSLKVLKAFLCAYEML